MRRCSRHGHIRLGPRNSRPEYSNLSWFTMLFAGGIGTVLMFWGEWQSRSAIISRRPCRGVEPSPWPRPRMPSRYRSITLRCIPGRSLPCPGWPSPISSTAMTARQGQFRLLPAAARGDLWPPWARTIDIVSIWARCSGGRGLARPRLVAGRGGTVGAVRWSNDTGCALRSGQPDDRRHDLDRRRPGQGVKLLSNVTSAWRGA